MTNIRIETIADMVKEGMVVADIGTDHALLPILLVQNNKSHKVYACDIAEGPLASAKANIEKYHYSSLIQTILSNGFEHVPDDSEVAVIAGMGYLTACGILDEAMHRLPSFKQIILEINRDPDEMRKWISSHHFTIVEERYVHERNHDYVIMSFTCEYHPSYTEKEILLGPVLMQKKEDDYIAYCQKQYEKYKTILEKSSGRSDASIQKKFLILEEFLKQ